MNFFKFDKAYVLIGVFAVLCFWQLAFMQYILKWDAVDIALPSRKLISDCLNNGILPLWNPYQKLGYPIHAEFSGVWYPPLWIISFLHGYDVHAQLFEFVLHIFLAGAGMYKLSKGLGINKHAALIVSCSYMVSGFMIGNSQHCVWVFSATWLPFIIHYFRQSILFPSVNAVIKTSLCVYLLYSGGYIAITFILFYLLLFIFCGYLFVFVREKNFSAVKKLLIVSSSTAVLSAIVSTVVLIGNYIVFPYITRGEILSLHDININPFSPQSMISFLLPLSTAKETLWDTDQSMANGYFGLAGFGFFLVSLFQKKSKTQWLFLIFGMIVLFASFGKYTPVRGWLYEYFPAMNLFRFPAVFRVFFILCFLILAGFSLDKFFTQKTITKVPKYVFYFIFDVLLIALVFSILTLNWHDTILFNYTHFNNYFEHLPLGESCFLQSAVQLCFAGIFLWLILNNFSLKKKKNTFVLIALADLFVATQFSIPCSVISDVKASELHANMKKLPSDFPLPKTKKVIDIDNHEKGFSSLWINLSMLYREPSWTGGMSFVLKNYDTFERSPLLKITTNNTPVYLSSLVFPMNMLDTGFLKEENPNTFLFLENSELEKISSDKFQSSERDSVQLLEFIPGKVVAKIYSEHPQIVTLLQSDYPFWNVYVNKKIVPHFTSNYTFISSEIPAGESLVEFIFEAKPVIKGLYISTASLLFCIIFLSVSEIRKRK